MGLLYLFTNCKTTDFNYNIIKIQKNKQTPRKKIQKWQYDTVHNWLTHMLRRSGIEPNNPCDPYMGRSVVNDTARSSL